MPLSKSGKKILKKFQKEYGTKEGKSVFYAKMNAEPSLKKKWEAKAKYDKAVT